MEAVSVVLSGVETAILNLPRNECRGGQDRWATILVKRDRSVPICLAPLGLKQGRAKGVRQAGMA